jgi:hypothetical protein
MSKKQPPPENSIQEIIEMLEQGKQQGWAQVNRSNISSLIIEADSKGNKKLAQELRDWL